MPHSSLCPLVLHRVGTQEDGVEPLRDDEFPT